MKPENTIENKAAFFALYWGQEVIASDKHTTQGLKPLPVCGAIMKEIDKYRHCYLLLKPLSSISDEDAIKVAKVNGGNSVIFGYRCLTDFGVDRFPDGMIIELKVSPNSCTIDYLRSRGYALPWMGLSVDNLIQRGWVKLKQEVEK